MPYSINGIGTGLVAASKKRVVEGHVQFDAIEALVVFLCPLVPYKVVHVLSIWNSGEGEEYQSMKLRFAPRLIIKAFLNRWGNVLSVFGAATGGIAGIAFATMQRPFNDTDANVLVVCGAMLVLGLACKAAWRILDARDERIKDLIGAHELGSADPLYWTDETAQEFSTAILQQHGQSSLADVSRRALAEGDRTLAMLCTRLAMRDKLNVEAEAVYQQLLHA